MPDAHAAGLTVGLALMGGVLAQVFARKLRIPGIVLLLITGVLLGPDVLNWVRPSTLGPSLQTVIGFAVAVILFEGSLSLDLRRLRREARVIQLLVTVGAVITATGAALCARYLMGWQWVQSWLFGTLVMVTGPTVINPLLQRLRLKRGAHTVLEAEGIFVDAVGAIVAVVALEVALAPHGHQVVTGLEGLGTRVGVGLGVGIVSGVFVALCLRKPGRIPDALVNVFTLAMVLGAFQLSNAFAPESGVIAVITMGLWVGNFHVPVKRELVSFKEQLTILLIGLLFVLLAADVRLTQVMALGGRGVATVACLMFVVRPASVFLCTRGSELSLRERTFVAWLGPRGIVAAAVASLFAVRLGGTEQGEALRALVFLVIAVTVGVQGLSSGVVANALDVRRPLARGYVILGADGLARVLAGALKELEIPVLLIEVAPELTRQAEEAGLKVLFGNGLDERTLLRTEPEGRKGFIGLTPNEAVNVLFVQRAQEWVGARRTWTALHRGHVGVGSADASAQGARVLFGDERELNAWSTRANRDGVVTQTWRLEAPQMGSSLPAANGPVEEVLIPLLWLRDGAVELIDETTELKAEDRVVFAVTKDKDADAREWLLAHGWTLFQTG